MTTQRKKLVKTYPQKTEKDKNPETAPDTQTRTRRANEADLNLSSRTNEPAYANANSNPFLMQTLRNRRQQTTDKQPKGGRFYSAAGHSVAGQE